MISNNFTMVELIVNCDVKGAIPDYRSAAIGVDGLHNNPEPVRLSFSGSSRSDSSSTVARFPASTGSARRTPTNWRYRTNRIPTTIRGTRPTIIFAHGWKPNQAAHHRAHALAIRGSGFRGYGDARPGGVLVQLECWRLRLGAFADKILRFRCRTKVWTTGGRYALAGWAGTITRSVTQQLSW